MLIIKVTCLLMNRISHWNRPGHPLNGHSSGTRSWLPESPCSPAGSPQIQKYYWKRKKGGILAKLSNAWGAIEQMNVWVLAMSKQKYCYWLWFSSIQSPLCPYCQEELHYTAFIHSIKYCWWMLKWVFCWDKKWKGNGKEINDVPTN